MTQDLEPGREFVLSDPSVEGRPSTHFRPMLVSTTINVVETQELDLGLTATRAGFSVMKQDFLLYLLNAFFHILATMFYVSVTPFGLPRSVPFMVGSSPVAGMLPSLL
jgi:hypothetical protein